MLSTEKIKEIIEATAENYESLRRRNQKCGCYHCLEMFETSELDEENRYCHPGGKPYSVCEYCGIDALLCEDDLAGLAPLDKETLKEFHHLAFEVF